MNPTTTLHAHAPHVSPSTPDRFDAMRRDRMRVGSILQYCRTLARIDRLAEKADEVLRLVDEALQGMDRIALETIRLEVESKAAPRNLLGVGPDYEDAAEWPEWTDRDTWTCTEPTPIEVLALDVLSAPLDVPPVRGGCEPFVPSQADWADYFAHRDDPLTERDVITATGSF
jgi:hypothetical protein